MSREGSFRNLRTSALISSVLLLPFVTLELVNRRGFHEDFPIVLFGLLWLLPLSFILIASPVVRTLPAGNSSHVSGPNLLFRTILVILIAYFWAALVIDQMPCFLGVSNCD